MQARRVSEARDRQLSEEVLRDPIRRRQAVLDLESYPLRAGLISIDRTEKRDRRATKKRQTPAPIPPRLLVHMRRWKARRLIAACFVEFNGKPVASVKRGFQSAVRLAGLAGRVTPHTLRHTAATWLMQRGVPIWEAAGFLGMSPEVLQETYGHHHPDFLHGAAAAIGQKGRYVSVVESVVDSGTTSDQNEKSKENMVGVVGFEPTTPASRTPFPASPPL